jgi:cytochrome P450
MTGAVNQDSAVPAENGADVAFDGVLSAAGRSNPYPHYARLREIAPVYLTGDAAVLTRYGDCDRVLREAEAFPTEDAERRDAQGRAWRESPAVAMISGSMLGHNPPEHTRLRRLVSSAFTARRVQALGGEISTLIDRRLDAMAEAGADGGVLDFHELFALPLPMTVIGELLGIPERDIPWLRDKAKDLAEIFEMFGTDEGEGRADRAQLAITPYLRALAETRRAEPRADLMSALVAAREESAGSQAALTDDELVSAVSLLFLAGYETTVNLLTNSLVELLRHPDQAALLRGDPGLAAQCVEESLRYDTAVQGMTRHAAEDCEFGGVGVPAGTEVVTLLGAANRDPERFADPDRFDITRTGPKVLSFGAGIHFCLGAPLARLEASLALPAILGRFPNLAPAGEPTRRTSFNLRGYETVPVTVR